MNQFANGKLLITGEYLVLDGAEALSLPTRHGQYLFSEKTEGDLIRWTAYDANYNVWLDVTFDDEGNILNTSDKESTDFLKKIFSYLKEQGKLKRGVHHKSYLTFDRKWGLGSSSTLVSLVANFYKVDAFDLLENTFGGSGYDVATAFSKAPIIYSNVKSTRHQTIDFNPSYKQQIVFVYLNKKQNSREGISKYRSLSNVDKPIDEINQLTKEIIAADSTKQAIKLFRRHEDIIANVIQQPKVQDELFSDFDGVVKSLGAWGGDYVMAIHEKMSVEDMKLYFAQKGYGTCFKYADLIL